MSRSETVQKRRPARLKLSILLPLLLLGALSGVLLARLEDTGAIQIRPGAVVVAASLGLFLQILVHEAGHVLAGLGSGLRLVTMAVGPLRYESGRGLRWRRSPLLGFAYLMPPAGMALPQITASFRRMVMGGPAAGFAFGVLCAGLALASPDHEFRTFWWVTALLGAVINLLSVVPMVGGGLLNDGARYRRLRPGAPQAGAEAALIALIAAARVQRPRDWPAELMAAALQPHDAPTFDASARSLAAAQAIDTGDLERAAELQRQASELIGGLAPALRASFTAEEVYLSALRGQASEARAHFDRLPRNALMSQVMRLRVEAAVLLAEGRRDEAQAALNRARLDLTSPLASRGIEAAWLDELEARLGVPV